MSDLSQAALDLWEAAEHLVQSARTRNRGATVDRFVRALDTSANALDLTDSDLRELRYKLGDLASRSSG